MIGTGPNGLAAAIRMAQAGFAVTVYESEDTFGGGCRSAALTLPGFVHDVCSAIHPLGIGSPFFRTLALEQHGLRWVHPDIPLAHPLDDGTAAVLERSIEATAAGLGADESSYSRLVGSLVPNWPSISDLLLRPARMALHPIGMARFGLCAIQSAESLANHNFRTREARALFAGLSAHSFLPLDQPVSGGFGLVLAIMAHAVGWPLPRGGSQRIADALVAELTRLGGAAVRSSKIESIDALPADSLILADVSAANLPRLAGAHVTEHYRDKLAAFLPGPAVFKVDYALDAPVPWTAAACRRAGTVHLGGTFEEIASSEAAAARGEIADRPFVLVAQQSLFDNSRAPEGKHTLWAYCHVPLGSNADMTASIEAQIERFAPGFAKIVLARHVSSPADIERRNANNAGGDITGGAYTLRQMLARPVASGNPWTTTDPRIFLCSASTPPGGGVHGMCGYYAAQSALGRLWKP